MQTTQTVAACALDELKSATCKVVSIAGKTILVVYDDGRVFALDNRCPHMGFPLHRGTVRDGILTCHWHHAKFDLSSGCTLDPFADDAPAFSTEIRDGDVFVDPRPVKRDERGHWLTRLNEALEQ